MGAKTMPRLEIAVQQTDGGFKPKPEQNPLEPRRYRHRPGCPKLAGKQPTPGHCPRRGNGAWWVRMGGISGKEYVSLSPSAPEFGPRKLSASLGRAVNQDGEGVFALIWNPAD
jgi:hypothetical protein